MGRLRRKAKSSVVAKRSTQRKRRRGKSSSGSQIFPAPEAEPQRKVACGATFFDTLSPEVLRQVLHYGEGLLTRCGIQCLNSLLFELRGPFRRIAASEFHTLHLHCQRRIRCWPSRGVLELGRDDERAAIERVLTVSGASMRRVELHACSVKQAWCTDADQYAALIARCCPGVERLLVAGLDSDDATRDTFDALACALGPQLKVLNLRSTMMVGIDEPAVLGTTAARQLATLAADGRLQLREFSYRGDSVRHLDPLWDAVRNTLRKVHLVYEEHADWLPTFAALRKCTALEDIVLQNPLRDSAFAAVQVTEEQYADFFASFGTRLRHAQLCSIGEVHLQRIVKTCPNLRATLIEKRCNFKRVGALAPCLDKLVMRVKSKADWKEMKKALKSCRHLTSLKVYSKPDLYGTTPYLHDDCFNALFHENAPLNHLEHLDLRIVLAPFDFKSPTAIDRINSLSDVTDNLYNLTGRLRSLNIRSSDYLHHACIRSLILANPFLEKFAVEDLTNRPEDECRFYIRYLVNAFLCCKQPRKLSIAALGSKEPDPCFLYWISTRLESRGVDHHFAFQTL